MDEIIKDDELGKAVNDLDNEGDTWDNEGDTIDNVDIEDLIDLQGEEDIDETDADF